MNDPLSRSRCSPGVASRIRAGVGLKWLAHVRRAWRACRVRQSRLAHGLGAVLGQRVWHCWLRHRRQGRNAPCWRRRKTGTRPFLFYFLSKSSFAFSTVTIFYSGIKGFWAEVDRVRLCGGGRGSVPPPPTYPFWGLWGAFEKHLPILSSVCRPKKSSPLFYGSAIEWGTLYC